MCSHPKPLARPQNDGSGFETVEDKETNKETASNPLNGTQSMPTETVLKSNDIETVAPARVGDTLGYARVSTHDQNPDAQSDRLIEAGAIRVFTDIVSGKRFDRPALAELIDHARPGDRLCIIRLDRLGRSLRELLETVDGLKACGIHLVQPRGAPRHLVRGRRTRVPRLRLHRALRAPAHLRAYPRRHRRGQETRANTGSTTARPGDGFRRPETHRGRIVTRSSRKTARHWQGNGLQNRKGAALKSKPRPFGPLE